MLSKLFVKYCWLGRALEELKHSYEFAEYKIACTVIQNQQWISNNINITENDSERRPNRTKQIGSLSRVK